MRKKSQIKMTETIGILVIFFILLLFGIIFYAQYQKSSIKKQETLFLEKQAVASSLKTIFLQEIRCEETETTGTCIDLYKLDALKKKILQKGSDFENYYSNVFYGMKISVKNLILKESKEIVLSESPITWTRKTNVQTPIILRDSAFEQGNLIITKNYFGVLNVEVYR